MSKVDYSEILTVLEQCGGNKTAAARQLGRSRNTILKAIRAAAPQHTASAPGTRRWRETDGGADLEFVTDKPIRTLDDALAAADVDLKLWWVAWWEASQWTVAVKERHHDEANPKRFTDKPRLIQCYRVKMRLAAIVCPVLAEATRALIDELAAKAPAFPVIIDRTTRDEPYLLQVDVPDVHFGKLAWSSECGSDYDLKIAERDFVRVHDELLRQWDTGQCERIVYPLGNDYVHVDNARSETYAGTRVDSDGRLAKIIQTAQRAAINAIERLASVAPVDVLWVPGNHDMTASYWLALILQAYFRNCDRVRVDVEPKPRKYYRYGAGLIGYTHGNEERAEDLPLTMATERPVDWGQTTWREFHLGHNHKSKAIRHRVYDERHGVMVRWIRALCTSDSWHYTKGYTGNRRGAEAYRWWPTTGYGGHVVAYIE